MTFVGLVEKYRYFWFYVDDIHTNVGNLYMLYFMVNRIGISL
jgi:hypothetical protein